MAVATAVVAILMLFYLLSVVGQMVLLWFINNGYFHIHGMINLGGVAIQGISLMVFRVLRSVPTRINKYIHAVLHFCAIGMYIAAYIFSPSGGIELISDNHKYTSYLIYIILISQILVALFIFVYVYEDQYLRRFFAPFHDIMGLWIFICLVGECVIGLREVKCVDNKQAENIWYFYGYYLLSYGGGIIVPLVVLCPLLEWDLIGNL